MSPSRSSNAPGARASERSADRGTWALAAFFIAGMWWLFREPLATYRVHSDDFAYLSASRTWDRATENLFRAHNTHIVPAWRLWVWLVMSAAGELARLQTTLAIVSFGALVVVVLLVQRVVARETGMRVAGMAAMIVAGTTSVMKSSATWFSSGQTLWASTMILAMLALLQSWRRRGGWWRMALACLAAASGGAFWTIGHAAGPVGAVYLCLGSRGRTRWAALLPAAATAASVALLLALGGRDIDARISFHGRTEREAINLAAGATHTLQAIPENLLCGNLGLACPTTEVQGAVLSAALFLSWIWTIGRWGRPFALEGAGLCLIVVAYGVEWIFRGYLSFPNWRGVLPWYDTIPHVGFILALFCMAARVADARARAEPPARVAPLKVKGALGLVILQVALLVVHVPRVQDLFLTDVPRMTDAEAARFLTRESQLVRAQELAREFARRQRFDLAQLDMATRMARSMNLGRAQISRAFGRVEVLELPDVYDAVGLLDLPLEGSRAAVPNSLEPYFRASPAPEIPEELLRSIPVKASRNP